MFVCVYSKKITYLKHARDSVSVKGICEVFLLYKQSPIHTEKNFI